MKTNYLSAPVSDLNPSLVAMAAWDSRSPAISLMEAKRKKVCRVGFALILAVALGSCVVTELRAQVIVVPNTLATNDGNSFNTSPDGPGSVREMQIYDASHFGTLSGPSFLTQFAYRPDTIPGPSGPRSFTLRIHASTTLRSVEGLSTTFDENLGTNNTLVFDGTVNATTGNLPGPGNTRQFDYVFPFTTPFLYDPADGNLLLDIQFIADGSSIRLDSVTGNSMLGEVINFSDSNGTTGSLLPSLKVTQFTFEPPPKVTVRLGEAVYWTTEGNDVVWLTVERRNGVAQEPFTVQYATSDLTAKAGLDYETATGGLSFAAGETNKTVAIKIFNDELQENEETFRVTLSNLTGWAQMGSPATATVRILQDTVLRALSSGANLTHTQERESVTLSFTSPTGPISVLGDLAELGNNNPNHAVRLVRDTDSVWSAIVSLPANRAYTYRFYRGSVPASDPITAKTRSVSRQPAAKTLYYHSSLSNPVLNWRQSSNGVFTATPMLRIGPGREVGESLWRAAGVGESGREIEFFIAEPAAAGRDPALGNHWTCLDLAFLQDGHLFNYVPAASVSPHRRDYDPDDPPSIRSEILNANRRYRVMLPRGYAEHPRRRYPVIYFHDGGAQWEIFPGGIGRTVVDPEGDIMAGLIRRGIMGEVIAVGIDIETAASNPSDARFRDYIPPGDQPSGIQGAADKYVQYIIQELKPLIDARYRTRPGPESTFTAGQSRGANVALYMAWDFPHVFTRAGSHSGTFEHAPNFMARVKQEPKRDIRIYLDSGEDSVSGVLALRDNLLAKSPPYVIEENLRYVYSRGQQHVTEDFASRRPMMLSFLYPVTEETNELVPRLEMIRQNGTRLRIVGPAGVSGRLQRSTDLREWSDWQSLTFGSEPVDLSEPQTSLVATKFYRVVTP